MEKLLTEDKKLLTPQQYPGYPGVRPPAGWVPPLDTVLTLLGVYDNADRVWKGLPLQAFVEALVHAEQLAPRGKIDSRNAATLTVPNLTAVGLYATRARIVVPAGEVWFVTQLDLATPAQNGGIVLANVRVSTWPDTATTPDTDGLPYWATNQGQAGGGIYTGECYGCAPALFPLGEAIGAPIRLPPGATLTIVAEVTVAPLGADRVVTLTPYGWKGKLLAPVS